MYRVLGVLRWVVGWSVWEAVSMWEWKKRRDGRGALIFLGGFADCRCCRHSASVLVSSAVSVSVDAAADGTSWTPLAVFTCPRRPATPRTPESPRRYTHGQAGGVPTPRAATAAGHKQCQRRLRRLPVSKLPQGMPGHPPRHANVFETGPTLACLCSSRRSPRPVFQIPPHILLEIDCPAPRIHILGLAAAGPFGVRRLRGRDFRL